MTNSRVITVLRSILLSAEECQSQGDAYYYLIQRAVEYGKSQDITRGEIVHVLSTPIKVLLP